MILEMHNDQLRARAAKSALKRLREKLRTAEATGGSIADELITDRRSESGNK